LIRARLGSARRVRVKHGEKYSNGDLKIGESDLEKNNLGILQRNWDVNPLAGLPEENYF
jgi:hypothetical protein